MTHNKTYRYTIPIFYVNIKVVVGDTMQDILQNKIFTKEDKDLYNKDTAALAFTQKDTIYIAVPAGKDDVQYLVHEIVHAKNFLYKMRGMSIDVNNDENEAYIVQYIYNKCEDAKRKFAKFVSKQRENETTTQQGTGPSGPGSQI
jgi:hypothetical protein